MKPVSSYRLLAVAICAVLGASATHAGDHPEPNATQLPRQVLPTGEEDAVQVAPAARFAVSAAASDRQLLEAELVEMTSESDEGLETVELSDGSAMVDLEGRFMSVMMMTPTPDGGTTIGCFTGHDAKEHAKHAQHAQHAKHAHDVATAKASMGPRQQTAPQALEEK